MGKVILVTGPSRSGKSEWAETLALKSNKTVVYMATANQDPADQEWQKRIQKHQNRRPQNWLTWKFRLRYQLHWQMLNPIVVF